MSVINHILINSKEKVRNYSVISSGISDHDFIHIVPGQQKLLRQRNITPYL